ncbi:MAG: hypothetical protein JXQ72_11620 [Anaerolineae bacterium]|nr:hypothetical protein [Anaerolineae bacterium]
MSWRRWGVVVLMVLAAVSLLASRVHARTGQLAIHESRGDAQINFTAPRRLLPSGCITVRWNVSGIQAVYLGENGVVGDGSQTLCGAEAAYPALLVQFPNGGEQTYVLPVEDELFNLTNWYYMLIAAALVLAADYVSGLPVLRRHFRRMVAVILWAVSATALLMVVYQAIEPRPTAVLAEANGVPIFLKADRSHTFHLDDCVPLRWDISDVREVYINGRGVVWRDTREACGKAGRAPEITVVLTDDTSHRYTLNVPFRFRLAFVLPLVLAVQVGMLLWFAPRIERWRDGRFIGYALWLDAGLLSWHFFAESLYLDYVWPNWDSIADWATPVLVVLLVTAARWWLAQDRDRPFPLYQLALLLGVTGAVSYLGAQGIFQRADFTLVIIVLVSGLVNWPADDARQARRLVLDWLFPAWILGTVVVYWLVRDSLGVNILTDLTGWLKDFFRT